MRDVLKQRATKDLRVDAATVDGYYLPNVQTWKVRSVLVNEQADADALATAAKGGGLGKASEKLVADGKAKAGGEQSFNRTKGLPEVVAAVQGMKPGEVSKPIPVKGGFAVVELVEIAYPEDPVVRADAQRMAMTPVIQKALIDYYQKLVKKHAVVNHAQLQALDYHAKKPGLPALEKDKRVLATIRGEAPVTVADLTAELKTQFFHGMDRAAAEGKINAKRDQFFQSLLFRRLLDKEAKVQKLAQDPELVRQEVEYERGVVFTAFLERVVVPEVKVTEEATRKYYDAHQAELRYPEVLRLEALGFARPADAQSACAKMKSGTDPKWLRANSEGLLPKGKRSLEFEAGVVTAEGMPDGMEKVLAGAAKGECRLYAPKDEEVYAVLVVEKTQAGVQPFEEVRGDLEPKVFKEELSRSIAEWAKRLREAHEVKVFVTGVGG
jgi:hypothetical protein